MCVGTIISTAALGASARAAGSIIDQQGQQFSVKALTLAPGDVAVFANQDDVTHNITVTGDDEAADLGLQKPGQNLSHRFGKPGRFKIRCSIHPSMRMTVVVR